ncbi:MAG: hypothetical protein AB2813_02315 [Candidatus Sedimenticola endophacoides]
MWNAVLAGVVYQHPSIESLRRELSRNPSLLQTCGFEVLPVQKRPTCTLPASQPAARGLSAIEDPAWRAVAGGLLVPFWSGHHRPCHA